MSDLTALQKDQIKDLLKVFIFGLKHKEVEHYLSSLHSWVQNSSELLIEIKNFKLMLVDDVILILQAFMKSQGPQPSNKAMESILGKVAQIFGAILDSKITKKDMLAICLAIKNEMQKKGSHTIWKKGALLWLNLSIAKIVSGHDEGVLNVGADWVLFGYKD
ncbi:hypothetical protein VTL71DRAFT_8979 [Oculimacula yallundae]|uniref:Uncharacterized protein n=1 Tax=Oculimacula yallundae TaxID=86028 RepID=A0ABR4BTF2_9HELO